MAGGGEEDRRRRTGDKLIRQDELKGVDHKNAITTLILMMVVIRTKLNLCNLPTF